MSSSIEFRAVPAGVFHARCSQCGWEGNGFSETYFEAECETGMHYAEEHFSEEQRLTARLEIKFPEN